MGWWEEALLQIDPTLTALPIPKMLLPEPPEKIDRLTTKFFRCPTITSTRLTKIVCPYTGDSDEARMEIGKAQQLAFSHALEEVIRFGDAGSVGRGINRSRDYKALAKFTTSSMFDETIATFDCVETNQIISEQVSRVIRRFNLTKDWRIINEAGAMAPVKSKGKRVGIFEFHADQVLKRGGSVIVLERKSFRSEYFSKQKFLLTFLLLSFAAFTAAYGEEKHPKSWQTQFIVDGAFENLALPLNNLAIVFSDRLITPEEAEINQIELNQAQQTVNDWLLYMLAK